MSGKRLLLPANEQGALSAGNMEESLTLFICTYPHCKDNKVGEKKAHLLVAWWTEAHFPPLTVTQRRQRGLPTGRW